MGFGPQAGRLQVDPAPGTGTAFIVTFQVSVPEFGTRVWLESVTSTWQLTTSLTCAVCDAGGGNVLMPHVITTTDRWKPGTCGGGVGVDVGAGGPAAVVGVGV